MFTWFGTHATHYQLRCMHVHVHVHAWLGLQLWRLVIVGAALPSLRCTQLSIGCIGALAVPAWQHLWALHRCMCSQRPFKARLACCLSRHAALCSVSLKMPGVTTPLCMLWSEKGP